jgi:hypothetical protein
VSGQQPDVEPPVVQVLRGRPDATELAALVAVLTARAAHGGTGPAATGAPASLWGAPATLVRRPGSAAAAGWGGPSATLRG